jgi:hypothetical protein
VNQASRNPAPPGEESTFGRVVDVDFRHHERRLVEHDIAVFRAKRLEMCQVQRMAADRQQPPDERLCGTLEVEFVVGLCPRVAAAIPKIGHAYELR